MLNFVIEMMWLKVIVLNNFPELMWGLGRNGTSIGTRRSNLILIAKIAIWDNNCSYVVRIVYEWNMYAIKIIRLSIIFKG